MNSNISMKSAGWLTLSTQVTFLVFLSMVGHQAKQNQMRWSISREKIETSCIFWAISTGLTWQQAKLELSHLIWFFYDIKQMQMRWPIIIEFTWFDDLSSQTIIFIFQNSYTPQTRALLVIKPKCKFFSHKSFEGDHLFEIPFDLQAKLHFGECISYHEKGLNSFRNNLTSLKITSTLHLGMILSQKFVIF